MEKTELIIARGHRLVKSTHRTTFEITKETHLTERGDCIVAVGSNKGSADLDKEFRDAVRKAGALVSIIIEADGETDIVRAFGNPGLLLAHPTDIVVRKSNYISDRTLAVRADKSANELSRRLVNKLKDPNQIVKVTITVSGQT